MLQSFLLTLLEGVSDRVWLAVGAGLLLTILLLVVLLINARRHRAPAAQDPFGWGDAQPAAEPAVSEEPVWDTAAFPEATPASATAPDQPLPTDPTSPQPGGPSGTGANVYYCRCPACQTQFTVNGTKPIVTNCPGCGKKGYLR